MKKFGFQSTSRSSNQDFLYLEPPPSYDDVVKGKSQSSGQSSGQSSKQTTSTSNTPRTTSLSNENELVSLTLGSEQIYSGFRMVDDEKLALMLQNEEFLRYLKENATFMREIYGNGWDYFWFLVIINLL